MGDTYGDAFVLVLVNAVVVFLTLWLLSLTIRLTRWILSKTQPKDAENGSELRDKHVKVLTGFQSEEFSEDEDTIEGLREEAEPVSRDELDGSVRAAIVVALAAYMSPVGGAATPVFQRGKSHPGARGRTSRRILTTTFRMYGRQQGS